MKDLNNLSYSELLEIRQEYETKGFKKSVGFVVVASGLLTGTICLNSYTENKKKITEPIYSFMPFSRMSKTEKKEIPLFWDAVKFDAVHNETGKSYGDLKVSASAELVDEVNKPENHSRKCTLLSSVSKDGQGRDRSIITFVEWN